MRSKLTSPLTPQTKRRVVPLFSHVSLPLTYVSIINLIAKKPQFFIPPLFIFTFISNPSQISDQQVISISLRKMAEAAQEVRERNGTEKKPEEEVAPLKALNHVSRVCRDVKESIEFYKKILGFAVMDRPQVLDFEGAWLFNYGVGIHLVQCEDDDKLPSDSHHLDPQDNHISFQCENMEAMEERLKKMNVKYMKKTMETEKGAVMDQIFFNDPDGFMVEICNCEDLKLVPSSSSSLAKLKLPSDRHTPPVEANHAAPTAMQIN